MSAFREPIKIKVVLSIDLTVRKGTDLKITMVGFGLRTLIERAISRHILPLKKQQQLVAVLATVVVNHVVVAHTRDTELLTWDCLLDTENVFDSFAQMYKYKQALDFE